MSRAGAYSGGVSGAGEPARTFERRPGSGKFGLAAELRRIADSLLDPAAEPGSTRRAALRLIQISDGLSGDTRISSTAVSSETQRLLSTLSSRERQIFTALSDGLSVQEIAERLNRSPKTINNHRTRLMHKLELRNMSELTRLAIRLGITTV